MHSGVYPFSVQLVIITFKMYYVSRNPGICAILRLRCAFSEFGNCVPISRLCTRDNYAISRLCGTSVQYRDYAISAEIPGCRSSFHHIQVRNVRKELLLLRQHHELRACTHAPHARDFGHEKFANSEKLSSISQLRCSNPVSVMFTNCACAISKCILQSLDWLCNLEIGMQFPDSENAQCNLEIARIPGLRGTCTYYTQNMKCSCKLTAPLLGDMCCITKGLFLGDSGRMVTVCCGILFILLTAYLDCGDGGKCM